MYAAAAAAAAAYRVLSAVLGRAREACAASSLLCSVAWSGLGLGLGSVLGLRLGLGLGGFGWG